MGELEFYEEARSGTREPRVIDSIRYLMVERWRRDLGGGACLQRLGSEESLMAFQMVFRGGGKNSQENIRRSQEGRRTTEK
jgi:hypothetical protein